VHKFIEGVESVIIDASFVPVAAMPTTAKGVEHTGRPHTGGHHKSPSHSDSRRSMSTQGTAPQDIARDTRGVQLQFKKQAIPASLAHSAPGVRAVVKPSSLVQQLSVARGTLDDTSFPRGASMAIHKYTVHLPHEEGAMVQIAMQHCPRAGARGPARSEGGERQR